MSQNRLMLSNAAATGTALNFGIGGRFMFLAEGTFAAATVALQVQGPSGAWVGVAGASLTAPGTAIVDLAPGSYRVAITGGPPTGVYATLQTLD